MQLYSSVTPIGGIAAAATTLDSHFDGKLEVVTAGLAREFCSLLQNKLTREDASIIMDYMISLNAEVNPSVNYRNGIIRCLAKFCHFKQSFCPKERANIKQLDRKNVLSFLDSLRKSEIVETDPPIITTYRS
jgi:hypothetical protein